MTLREKLMHYTYDLDSCSNLKQEAITAIEHIAQHMDEDELLHHSRPLAIAYLALTEDVPVPMGHGWWIEQKKYIFGTMYDCSICGNRILDNGHAWNYCPNCGARMDGDSNALD